MNITSLSRCFTRTIFNQSGKYFKNTKRNSLPNKMCRRTLSVLQESEYFLIKEHLSKHRACVEKQFLERHIKTYLEERLKALPFGKEGLHKEAKIRLNGLTEALFKNNHKIHIGRYGLDSGINVTFFPEQWVYHGIFKFRNNMPYYASDLFRFNFLKGESVSEFDIRWPKKIVLEAIVNEETIIKMSSLDIRTQSGASVFLNRTPVGKHMRKVCEEFGFDINSIDAKNRLVLGSPITIGVKPVF